MEVMKGKVAKKLALYPPKKMLEELGLKEGSEVRYRLDDEKLVVEPLISPLEVAIKIKKWAKTSIREFEAESEEEQREYTH